MSASQAPDRDLPSMAAVREFLDNRAASSFVTDTDRQRFIDFAFRPGVTRRDFPDGHVTAGALVIDPAAREMVSVLHPKFGRWMQPGGHVEDTDETVIHAAAREVFEETGLLVDPKAGRIVQIAVFDDIPCPTGRSGSHYDVRVAWLHPRVTLRLSHESDAVAWLPIDALPQPHDADLARLAKVASAFIA